MLQRMDVYDPPKRGGNYELLQKPSNPYKPSILAELQSDARFDYKPSLVDQHVDSLLYKRAESRTSSREVTKKFEHSRNEQSLNESFNSRGSKKSIGRPPRPKEKSSQLMTLRSMTLNSNRHPGFTLRQDSQDRQKTMSREEIEDLGRLVSQQDQEDLRHCHRVLKDVYVLNQKGKVVKKDLLISLDPKDFSNTRRQPSPVKQTKPINNGGESPSSNKVGRTLGSLSRERKMKNDRTLSYFDSSFDSFYEEEGKFQALREFMVDPVPKKAKQPSTAIQSKEKIKLSQLRR